MSPDARRFSENQVSESISSFSDSVALIESVVFPNAPSLSPIEMDAIANAPMRTVCAVVVTHQPDAEVLMRTIASLCDQVDRIIVVDNTPAPVDSPEIQAVLSECDGLCGTAIHRLGSNTGVAFAQNYGIKLALALDFSHVLISDQDTVFPSDCVRTLLHSLSQLDSDNVRIAAIAPCHRNSHAENSEPFFLGFENGWTSRISGTTGCVEVSAVISSGMLIPLSVVRNVGLMNDELFIDWVDFEWCWRARAKGYKVIGCFDSVLDHRLGDDVVKVGRGSLSVRAPVRNYYIARNGVHLAIRSHLLPPSAAFRIWYRVIVWSMIGSLFPKPRIDQAANVLKGIYHGFIGRMGPMERPTSK